MKPKRSIFVLKVYLEEMMQISADLKKSIIFDKGAGTWYWCDRDEEDQPKEWHTNFPSFLAALRDVTDPYMDGWGGDYDG